MRILLEKPGPRVEPPMKMKVEYSNEMEGADLPDLKKGIKEKMSARIRVRPDITFVSSNTLERAADHQQSGSWWKNYMTRKNGPISETFY